MTPEAEIRRRISDTGPITFAKFMELALYWPQGGYYSDAPPSLGAEPVDPWGDYYTSPMVHPAFGALLAIQIYQCWRLLNCPDPFYVVELGAGNGLLCADIMAAAAKLPEGYGDCLRYLCLERRNIASTFNSGDLDPVLNPAGTFAGNALRFAQSRNHPGLGYERSWRQAGRLKTDTLPLRNLKGCILSNELLDAFPIHRARMEGGRLREVYVGLDRSGDGEGRLVEIAAEPSAPALADRWEELGLTLAEGQTAEVNLALDSWASAAAAALSEGFVITIDYGQPAVELYSAQRRFRGTLTTYYRHVQTDAPLRNIGRQDITAQVDFTSVAQAGNRAGLVPLGFATQRDFLRNLGLDRFRRRLAALPLSPRQAQDNQTGLLALARPGGLGGFKVLAQGKNVGHPQLWGFAHSSAAQELAQSLPLPQLTDQRLSLAQGWSQPSVQEFELTDFGDDYIA